MEYLIALTLLVLVGAWVVGAYIRLHHLYVRVQGAWKKWHSAAEHRNECLGDFVAVFACHLPQEDMLARDIRRWSEDSRRALAAQPAAPLQGHVHELELTERHLRRILRYSGRAMEATPQADETEQLLGLYHTMALSDRLQQEEAHIYNRTVRDFNAALDEPAMRLIGPTLGFSPIDDLQGGKVGF